MTKFDQLYQQVTLSEELGEHKPVFASIREILSEHPGRTLGEHPGRTPDEIASHATISTVYALASEFTKRKLK